MNSYRRRRSRPRKVSVSFRSFGWVLAREAALHVLCPEHRVVDVEPWRRWLAAARTDSVRRAVESVLRKHPGRRYCL